MGFIRKVYAILSTQLVLTACICALSMTSQDFLIWQVENWWVLCITFPLAIIASYALYCYPKVARTTPGNYIWLFIFTLCEAYSVSLICGCVDPTDVFIALSLTSAIVVGITLYCFTNKGPDFRPM